MEALQIVVLLLVEVVLWLAEDLPTETKNSTAVASFT
jgi:hypothetical protein